MGRRRIVGALLDQLYPAGSRPLRILDVGCGTGGNLIMLDRWGGVVGLDSAVEALRFCRERRRANLVQATADVLPFREGSFDLITALDVLEHIQDDRAALSEFHRVLRPGGHAVLTVPAYRFIWSEHDEALHHKRRYVLRELRGKAATAGFQVGKSSYAISAILPVAIVFRMLQGMRPSSDQRAKTAYVRLPAAVNGLLSGYLGWEAGWLRRASLPAGLSIVCVAERAPESRQLNPQAGSASAASRR